MFRKRESVVPEDKKAFTIMVDGEQVSTLCNYNDHGVTCSRRGTIAATTNGKGPWYCRDHAWVILNDRKQEQKRSTTWNSIKAELDGLIRGREPGQEG